jgi:uncharacterized protein (DUF305 family)
VAAAGLALVLGAAGCGGDDPARRDMPGMQGMHEGGSASGEGDAARQAHNDADVTFATDMIPHHAQALMMVNMTEGRDLSPDFAALTAAIRAAQAPEIDLMAGWLEDWGEPVPETDGHMSGGGMAGMGGMAGRDDLDRLRGASRSAFEQMWLRMMIVHHEGAVEMARTEVEAGEYPPTVALARSIAESQTAEIATMRDMLS